MNVGVHFFFSTELSPDYVNGICNQPGERVSY